VNDVYYGLKYCIVSKTPLIPKFFLKFFGKDFSIRELLIGAQQATQGILFLRRLYLREGLEGPIAAPLRFPGHAGGVGKQFFLLPDGKVLLWQW